MAKKKEAKTEAPTLESVLAQVAEVRESESPLEIVKVDLMQHTHHGSIPLDRFEPKDFIITTHEQFVQGVSKKTKAVIQVPWSNVAAVHYKLTA